VSVHQNDVRVGGKSGLCRDQRKGRPQGFRLKTVQGLGKLVSARKRHQSMPTQPRRSPCPGRKTLKKQSAANDHRREADSPNFQGRQRRIALSLGDPRRIGRRRDPSRHSRAGGPGLRWFWSVCRR